MSRARFVLGATWTALFVLASFLLGVPTIHADIRLPAIIGDNMVLQRDRAANIWGWADPGEEVRVRVSWNAMQWSVRADQGGQWRFRMSVPDVGGPYEITLVGKNTVSLKNIMVGEVWVCSGQSNMEMPVQDAGHPTEEAAAADYPDIRFFTVQRKIAGTPRPDCVGQWSPCTPQTTPAFSAVGYYFGRYLHGELDVPVGLIHTSWGGTVAEAWTEAECLAKMPEFKAPMERLAEARANPEASIKKYEEEMAAWQKKLAAGAAQGGNCIDPDFNDSAWQEIKVPAPWDETDLADFDGLVWFRKTVDVPADWAGKELTLDLGPIDDKDTVWVNGVKIGAHTEPAQWHLPRTYRVDPNLIEDGRCTIVVQVLDTSGPGGIYGQPEQVRLRLTEATDETPLPLAGTWRYKIGCDLKSLPPEPQSPRWASNPNTPTVLYNGMIAPLVPLRIRGAIWYQGESNADRAYQYRELFPLMIRCWREKWGQGNFPFLFVQLANFRFTEPEPVESAWAELREAQTMTLDLPNTGMAVIIDIGEARDIHPKNKQDVGKRLALWALANTYGQNVVYSGPLYKSMEKTGSKIILHFDHVDGGLVAKGDELKGFAIAGADRKFIWADARIEGNTVVVSSESISDPEAVRYAWADNPVCNLYNEAGLPASPFRTDQWPGVTAGKK